MTDVITLADLKVYLRYASDDDSNDTALSAMVLGGQSWIESFTGKLLTPREVVETPSAIGSYYDLQWGPLLEDSLEVDYFDTGYSDTNFSDFVTFEVNGKTRLKPTVAFPSSAVGIRLTYVAGYETVSNIPDVMVHALYLYVGMSDEERSNQSSAGWEAMRNLLSHYHTPVLR